MKKKLSKKAKIIISSVGVFVLILGSIAYWAADRFLIEHVELDLSNMPAANSDFAEPSSEAIQVTPGGELTLTTEAIQVTPEGNVVVTKSVDPKATKDKAANANPNGDPKAIQSKEPKATPGGDKKVTENASTKVKTTPKANIKAVPSNKVASRGDGEDNKDKKIDDAAEVFTLTDLSYKSNKKSIEINKVVTGSGDDTLTYYVADVKLTNITQLKTAFAKNKFGRNIIEYTSVIAKENDAIFAMNGDYYGFREDGIEIRNGMLLRNKPARTGLAFYKDGSMKIYDEKQTTGEELLNKGVWSTISFGPALLIDGNIGTDIDNYEVDTNVGNHPIQGRHPRAGIGMIDKNHFVFIVVDGRSKGYSKGVTLQEFAKIFQGLGCKVAYNVDGGYSATMYFNDNRINKPGGKEKERGTSDIIYIK